MKLIFIFNILFFIFLNPLHAEIHVSQMSFPNDLKCGKAILQTVKKWGAIEEVAWKALEVSDTPSNSQRKLFFSNSGTRIELLIASDKTQAKTDFKNHTLFTVWPNEDCVAKISVKEKSIADREDFTDADLVETLSSRLSNGKGIIYLWSPHMPLSIKGVKEMESIAKNLNIAFFPLLDPYADIELATSQVRKMQLSNSALRKLASESLALGGAANHFPTQMVFRSGKIENIPRPGYIYPPTAKKYVEDLIK